MRRLRLAAALVAVVAFLPLRAASAEPEVTISYETGPAYIAQNDGRYGVGGTPFEAEDVGQQDNLLRSQRASVEVRTGRHRFVALHAPFRIETRFALEAPLRFRSVEFPAGSVVDHRYRFDGYRASYLYELRGGAVRVEAGVSLQIRDAEVAFSSVDGMRAADQPDIGLVPALKARVTYTPGKAWGALEVDGLSTFGLVGDTSGGLYDAALIAGYPLGRDLDVYANVRLLGGGAEVPDQQIDNWANFVSASLGLRVEL